MCGRYTLHTNKKKLLDAIALEIPEQFEPDYNIGPGRDVLGITHQQETGAAAVIMHWGLRTPQNFHVNARLETADTSPRFRDSWATNRCLLPANGFYEWFQDGVSKQPYYIYPSTQNIIFFAALWFEPPFDGAPPICVILTTQAQADIRKIHHRMPVIIPNKLHHEWLKNELSKEEVLAGAYSQEFSMHPVSYRVNSIQNKDSRLTQATAPEHDEQMRLF